MHGTNDRPHRCLHRSLAIAIAGVVVLAGCSDSEPTGEELAGVDSDGDGVRDDVATYIDTFDSALHPYLLEVAANEQQVVTLDPDASDAAEVAYEIATAANRLASCPPAGADPQAAWDAAAAVRESVADTEARQQRQDVFTALISGRAFPEPDCSGNDETPS
jgi:hypothetical protein